MLGPSVRSLFESFYAGLSKPVSEAFRAGSIWSRLHADAGIEGITHPYLEGAASEDDGVSI